MCQTVEEENVQRVLCLYRKLDSNSFLTQQLWETLMVSSGAEKCLLCEKLRILEEYCIHLHCVFKICEECFIDRCTKIWENAKCYSCTRSFFDLRKTSFSRLTDLIWENRVEDIYGHIKRFFFDYDLTRIVRANMIQYRARFPIEDENLIKTKPDMMFKREPIFLCRICQQHCFGSTDAQYQLGIMNGITFIYDLNQHTICKTDHDYGFNNASSRTYYKASSLFYTIDYAKLDKIMSQEFYKK